MGEASQHRPGQLFPGGSDAVVCVVSGLSHGKSITSVKVDEARQATTQVAKELDVAVNIGAYASEQHFLAAATLITELPVIAVYVMFQ